MSERTESPPPVNFSNSEEVGEHIGQMLNAVRRATAFEPNAFSRDTLFEILKHVDDLLGYTAALLDLNDYDLMIHAHIRSCERPCDTFYRRWSPYQDEELLEPAI